MTDICADQDMEGNALLTIDRYVKAQSLKEAYELCQKRNNVVLGGMLWLKMQVIFLSSPVPLSAGRRNTGWRWAPVLWWPGPIAMREACWPEEVLPGKSPRHSPLNCPSE